jgi:hypothetical protein
LTSEKILLLTTANKNVPHRYFYSKDKLGEAEQGDVVSSYGRLAKSR